MATTPNFCQRIVLEPRVVASDDAGVWVVAAGASAVARTSEPDNGKHADGFWVVDSARRRLVRKVTTGGAVSGVAVAGDRLWFSREGTIYRMKLG